MKAEIELQDESICKNCGGNHEREIPLEVSYRLDFSKLMRAAESKGFYISHGHPLTMKCSFCKSTGLNLDYKPLELETRDEANR
jgi:hypothetical protein